MNKQEQLVYNAMSVTEYTPGIEFTPRLEGLVPDDEIYDILRKLESEGLAELCYGWGWRAIESDDSNVSEDVTALIAMWRRAVSSGATMLDFKRWFINETIKREKAEGLHG